jgi:hypothetical protein
MPDAIPTPEDQQPAPRYLLIVARDRPDILRRAHERFREDPRIEVIVDRRWGERRAGSAAPTVERRLGDRRRPATLGSDLRVYPTIVVQKRALPYIELQDQLATLSHQCETLKAENDQLRTEVATLSSRLEAWAAADSAHKAEVSAALAAAERALRTIREGAAAPTATEGKATDIHRRSA